MQSPFFSGIQTLVPPHSASLHATSLSSSLAEPNSFMEKGSQLDPLRHNSGLQLTPANNFKTINLQLLKLLSLYKPETLFSKATHDLLHEILSLFTHSLFHSTQKCTPCKKMVYLVDQLIADKCFFHKACFHSHHCKRMLKLSNYSFFKGVLYYKPHYYQLFKMTV